MLFGCASSHSPQLEPIARDANGRVGACAVLLETGERLELNASERYPMQSVYKIAIALAIVHDAERWNISLSEPAPVLVGDLVPPNMHSPLRDRAKGREITLPLSELIELAISESDGTASDVLLRTAGGCDAVMRALHAIDVHNVNVASTENEMGRDPAAQYRSWATPSGMITLLSAIHEGREISKEHRDFLIGCMTRSHNDAKRIKALLPPGTTVAHKTGSSHTIDGVTAATNDVGIIALPNGKHLAIAVFVSDSRADDAMRRSVIARIARTAYDHFTGPSHEN